MWQGQESLHAAPKRAMCEAMKVMKVKRMLQWRPQEVRDARNRERLPKTVTGTEQSQPKKVDMC